MKPNELYHHGKEGMRWGIRNGPPYPLNKEGKARLEKQRKLNNKGSGDILSKYRSIKISEINEDSAKRGLKIVGDYIKSLRKRGSGGFLNDIDTLSEETGFPKNDSYIDITESTQKVNQNHYKDNCFSSVTADILNRAYDGYGLDVVSRPQTIIEKALGGATLINMASPYKNSSIDEITVPKNSLAHAKENIANQIISTYGDDALGFIRFYRINNRTRGHYIKYEVQNGTCIFSDSMEGTIGADEYFDAMNNNIVSRKIDISNVSNLEIDPNIIKKFVVQS